MLGQKTTILFQFTYHNTPIDRPSPGHSPTPSLKGKTIKMKAKHQRQSEERIGYTKLEFHVAYQKGRGECRPSSEATKSEIRDIYVHLETNPTGCLRTGCYESNWPRDVLAGTSERKRSEW